jgi:hypothetical protein
MRRRRSRCLSRGGLTAAEHLEVCGVDKAIVGGSAWRAVFVLVAVVAAVWRGWAVGSVTVGT